MAQIHAKFLREAADVLAYPMSKVINLSVKLSVFLEEHKISKPKQKLQTYFTSAPSVKIY